MSHFLDWAGGRAATSSRPTPHMSPPHPAPHWSQPGPAAPCPGEGEPGGCRGVAAHSSGVLGTEELGLISAAGRCAHNWAAGLLGCALPGASQQAAEPVLARPSTATHGTAGHIAHMIIIGSAARLDNDED